MKCKDFKKLINLYIDNELSAEEKAVVDQHLAECERCRLEHEQLAKITELSRLVQVAEPAAEVLDNLTMKIRRKIHAERPHRRKMALPMFQVWPQVVSAAVIIFVACISLVIIFRTEEGRVITKQEFEKMMPHDTVELRVVRPGYVSGRTGDEEMDRLQDVARAGKETAKKMAVAKPAETPSTIVPPAISPSQEAVSEAAGARAKTATTSEKDVGLYQAKAAEGREAQVPAPKPTSGLVSPDKRLEMEKKEFELNKMDELIVAYDVAPTLAETVPISLPRGQDLSKVRRDVTVNVFIDSFGRVSEANMLRSSGDLKLDSSILNSVRQYRFQPAQYQNRRVRAQQMLRVLVR